MGFDANDFGIGGAVPGGHKESIQVVTGQLGLLEAIFCKRTIIGVSPDPQRRRGMVLTFSDGTSVGVKCSSRPKCVDLAYQGSSAEQPRHFVVSTG